MDEKPINEREHSSRRIAQEARQLERKERARIVSIAATGVALIGTGLSIMALFFANAERDRSDIVGVLNENRPRARQLVEQQKQIDDLRLQVQKVLTRPPPQPGAPPVSAEVTAINNRLSVVEAEQKRLGAIITDNPEKAMSIPLMRRDIEDMKTNQVQAADGLKREVDRLYDLNKWIIGGLAAGVLGLLVREIFGRRERNNA